MSLKRHQFVWKTLYALGHRFIEKRFHFSHDKNILSSPSLIIANHVTSWDPILLALSFPKNHLHFVASDHIFHWGFISKAINWLVEPLARRKGASGSETAMICLRKLRSGASVCIFGEGEVTWDGRSQPIFPGTGMLAKAAGANLVTYRFEGGCLTAPRWAKKHRKGKMNGSIVNIYTPEAMKNMSTEEIADAINRDIQTDAFAQQDKNPIVFRGKDLAEHLETSLFLCPQCKKIGTLASKGNTLSCSCGAKWEYTEYATFSPEDPFRNIQQWDKWQHECLQKGDFDHDFVLFSDENVAFIQVEENSRKNKGVTVDISLNDQGLFKCGKEAIFLNEIKEMAIVQANKLFFSTADNYYQLKAKKGTVNFRKYLAAWKIFNDAKLKNGLFNE
ncbi:MAG: 1-acyl-sn-glycerol-3-phosphate acyltransferase [Clostridia bacterium]|nr:1-acyl-sn-glycerol-3-phosphate acyltransferase [Clostridia bacterium]